MSEPQKPEAIAIKGDDGTVDVSDTGAVIWTASKFAEDWFKDALQESREQDDHNARRREILFSVAFAESYLVEWIRDEVFKGDFQRFHKYYMSDREKHKDRKKDGKPLFQRGVSEKFKEIPSDLHKSNLIAWPPDWSKNFKEFRELVAYRDGLVHASSSRPESGGMPKGEKPVATLGTLMRLPAAWAIRVVAELVKELHRVSGTNEPPWLILP
jgi:hypothetical protein